MGENSWAWEVRENLLIHAVLNLRVYDTGMEKLPTAPEKMENFLNNNTSFQVPANLKWAGMGAACYRSTDLSSPLIATPWEVTLTTPISQVRKQNHAVLPSWRINKALCADLPEC